MRTAGLPPELRRATWARLTPRERRDLRRQINQGIRIERRNWERVRLAERGYQVQLRQLARNVSQMVRGFAQPVDINQLPQLVQMLNDYARILDPWARATAERMIAEVMRRDASAWFKMSREIGTNLRLMIENTPMGGVVRQILEDQVTLITSLPVEAGRHVQERVQDFVASGIRYEQLVDEILGLEDITVSRATLIARTETAKAQSAIVTARAQHVGSEHFIWHTVRDGAVRPLHRTFEGKIYSWDHGPVLDDGEEGLPGTIYNCRCYAEPIIPAVIT